MNTQSLEAATALVPYVKQGREARRTHEKHIQILLEQKKLPEEGWDDARIQLLLQELSLMDSNNFPDNVGVGEREARIYSNLVAQRHFRLGHGIGRSGDVAAVQPKAAGSSLIMQLTNCLLLDIIRARGVHSARKCVLIPVATGMALLMVLLTLKQRRPQAKYVVWPRIDQKSCFKSIISAGLEPVVIENLLNGDQLQTNVAGIESSIEELRPENIVCVLTTTSCFAPRAIDKLEEVSVLCQRYDIPHLVNNAYGVQSSKCMHVIQEAHRLGRVDAFVQSTDKNFMVPVGGAVVASSSEEFINSVSQMYPGRASGTPSLDIFITLLSMGKKEYQRLCTQRKDNFKILKDQLEQVATKHGEKVLSIPQNPISIAVSLSNLPTGKLNVTEFGSMLFVKNVSGTRVVGSGAEKTIGPHTFTNWGSHCNDYPCAYFTAAAAIGMTRTEMDTFIKRLDQVFIKFSKRQTASSPEMPISTEN
ncbi:O-phosphoseryl-tRNA(Sec) selenium transferase-like [Halichondria panicea]|uniref:O-phosphoseryl-tRNA(Sec) selenium transferase-like n=1 Tax=Halichondria panicea TaxID=6063 RepID=UPI00312B343E